MPSHAKEVADYYNRRESRWGYKYLLKGTKHYGFFPNNRRLSFAESQLNMERELGRTLGLTKGARVLDAGCGEGFVALHLARDFGYQLRGIDILDWSIENAKSNAKKLKADIDFATMDYSNTNFADNTFDGVYTLETLVHSTDYKKTLKEFYRILKPGGVLVNFEYVLDDELPAKDEADWRVMFTECPMEQAFKDFRVSKVPGIWKEAGFKPVAVTDITQNMVPFMKKLHDVAFIPYYVLKMFGKQKGHVNTFAGVRSYQLRHEFHYTVIKAEKP